MAMHDRPPQLNLDLESSSLGLPLSLPVTPTSPTLHQDTKPKKTNPLNDLIDTEKAYTDLLGGVIKKVAAAWSRSNMPPPKLDTMFRSIESVYRSNRSLLAKLREIGTSSPKALGDLLIRWVDDLEGPYTSYCTQYCSGFDQWEPVQENIRLAPILASFSAANPLPTSNNSGPSLWTLDDLFLLPRGRLKYYKKLYSRLLKSTQSGRSDHRLLVEALEKLERLLVILEEREDMKVQTPPASPSLPVLQPEEEEVVIDMRVEKDEPESPPVRRSDPDVVLTSEGSSMKGSGESGFERLSQDAPSSSTSRGSSSTLSMPVTDLERRLSTQRTLDIFTMTPKMVKLQMSPPALTFTREFRCSTDIGIRLTPRSTGIEVVYQRGHIFLLSDLFLVCEYMTPQERAEHGVNGADMWLMYPPLSGKVLRISDLPGQDNALQVHIMRKETIILIADSVATRDNLYSELKGCIEFSASVGPVSKQPPPPVPPLPGFSASTSLPHSSSTSLSETLPSSARYSDSSHFNSSMRTSSSPPTLNGQRVSHNSSKTPEMTPSPRSSSGVESVTGHFSNMAMPPPMVARMSPHGPGPFPPVASHPPSIGPGQVFRNPSMTHGTDSPPPPAGPGQVFRKLSFTHGPGSPPPSVGSGQAFGPARTTSLGHGSGPAPGPPVTQMGGPSPPFSPQQPPMHRPNTNQPLMHPPGQQQMFAPRPMHRPYGPMGEGYLPPIPPRPPSEPSSNVIHKSPSTRSLNAAYHQGPPGPAPPMPNMLPGAYPPYHDPGTPFRPGMNNGVHPTPRPILPSSQFNRALSNVQSFADPSPPSSPVEETPKFSGPTTLTISANMKCKVFLKQQHQQWKSLGSARLKLYRQSPTNIKQLVVEADSKDHAVLISTIVLTDGVERVGKTGVAIELSDKGARTGIVYMLQLRSDEFAGGFFDSLLEGSDRRV